MPTATTGRCLVVTVALQRERTTAAAVEFAPHTPNGFIPRIKSSSHHEVTIPNLVFRCSEFGGVTDCNVPNNSPEQEAAMGHSIPRRIDSPTSQATQLPELGLTLTPATGREHSQEMNKLSALALISQAPGPSRKRSRSPSSPNQHPRHQNSTQKDSVAAAESEIAILQIRVADTESRRVEDHEQIQKILARLNL
ncbi:hypothetical protein Tco_0004052 [Tanacetum coccineum]